MHEKMRKEGKAVKKTTPALFVLGDLDIQCRKRLQLVGRKRIFKHVHNTQAHCRSNTNVKSEMQREWTQKASQEAIGFNRGQQE